MSKHNNYRNYQNYSNNKPQAEQPAQVEEAVVETEIEEVVEVVETVEAPAAEPAVEPTPEPAPAPKKARAVKGVVTDCEKLRVRKAPKADATVISMIDVDAEVKIDKAASTEEFYKVTTAAGVEGYCMKKFITVK